MQHFGRCFAYIQLIFPATLGLVGRIGAKTTASWQTTSCHHCSHNLTRIFIFSILSLGSKEGRLAIIVVTVGTLVRAKRHCLRKQLVVLKHPHTTTLLKSYITTYVLKLAA
jgi:hypothetical protein